MRLQGIYTLWYSPLKGAIYDFKHEPLPGVFWAKIECLVYVPAKWDIYNRGTETWRTPSLPLCHEWRNVKFYNIITNCHIYYLNLHSVFWLTMEPSENTQSLVRSADFKLVNLSRDIVPHHTTSLNCKIRVVNGILLYMWDLVGLYTTI